MARYRQVWSEEAGRHVLVPLDEAARRSHFIQGDMEPFVSPIDGTVISDRKQYRDHMKKHNVVPAEEFSPEYYARKAEERERLFKGEHTKEEKLRRKQELWEAIQRYERQ